MPRRVQWHRGVSCLVQGRDPLWPANDVIMNIFDHSIYALFDSKVRFGWHFKVHHLIDCGSILALEACDLSALDIINFVGNQSHSDILDCVLFDGWKPNLQVCERYTICHIIDQNDCICILVEVIGNGTEPFLAGCIPEYDGNRRLGRFVNIFRIYAI